MGTTEIKELLDDWLSEVAECDYPIYDVEKCLSKWKRLSKKRDAEGRENRVFINTVINRKILVIDEDIQGWMADGNYAFYIYNAPNHDFDETTKCYVAITNLEYFREHNAMNDWHLSEFLRLPDYLDEICEADFASEKSMEDLRADLLAYGLVEDKEFNDFMDNHR